MHSNLGSDPGGDLGAQAYPPQLLDDYLAIAARKKGEPLVNTALRSRSVSARLLLAHAATGGGITLAELIYAARSRDPDKLAGQLADPAALADLGRVIALQDIGPTDAADGLALLDLTLSLCGPDRLSGPYQGLHAQLAYQSGQHRWAESLLAIYRRLPDPVRTTLSLDLANPFTCPGTNTTDHWLAALGRMLPSPGVALADAPDRVPFDRLTTPGTAAVTDDDLVSVIVTTFCPDDGLFTALRSLTAQSWANLEILLVDDGSPDDWLPLLQRAAEQDARIRLIRCKRNGGTYLARNVGLEQARGRFITFQDSDDWSHSERVAQQVQTLQEDPALMATTTYGMRLTDQLVVTRPGRKPIDLNTSSLTFRREPVMRQLGYFDQVRKGADTEYMRRVEVVFGDDALRMVGDRPYALIRRSTGSLTGSDFMAGWMHPGRVTYQWAYRLWHEQIREGGAAPRLVKEPISRPFPAPSTHAVTPPASTPHYDVVLAGDWSSYGGPQKSMLEEIRALTTRGLRLGVLHLEAMRFMTGRRRTLCRPVQELINTGTVDRVLPTETARVKLLLVRYPPVLQFGPATPVSLQAKSVVIVANQAPSEADGSDLRYAPRTCTEAARRLFSAEPVWCPQGPEIRELLDTDLGGAAITDMDLPGVIDLEKWRTTRSRFRGDRPIIGRHARDNWTKWPADQHTLCQVYPSSRDVDVRFLGGAKTAQQIAGSRQPPNWVVYDYDEIDVRSFLYQLDFYVYFPHPTMREAFGRSVLEALAAGCLAILPQRFSPTFGDAAIYCEPGDVWGVVQGYYATHGKYLEQVHRAWELVRDRFSHDAHLARISTLLGE